MKHINTSEPVPTDVEYEKFIREVLKRSFWHSCADLLDWPEGTAYPEVK